MSLLRSTVNPLSQILKITTDGDMAEKSAIPKLSHDNNNFQAASELSKFVTTLLVDATFGAPQQLMPYCRWMLDGGLHNMRSKKVATLLFSSSFRSP